MKKRIFTKLESHLKVKLSIIAFLLCLIGGQAVQAGPTIILSVDKGSYEIGDLITYTITGAPPNSPIFWSSWKNGVSTGEVNSYYGHLTDSNGRFSAQVGPWTASFVGFWKKAVSIGGKSSFATFYVVPKLTTNLNIYPVGTFTTYSITGAPPNSPIFWSSWKDGVGTGEVNAFYGHFTDSAGNWSATGSSPWPASFVGHWKKHAKIGSTSNFGTSVEFLVTEGVNVNKSTYTVGELTNYSITGAPPNSPIFWSSWQDGTTREVFAFYNQYTNQFGNWSATSSSGWLPEWVGIWKKQATVGSWVKSVSFSVKPRALLSENTFAQKVSSYKWFPPGIGAVLVGDLGGRNLHILFNAPACGPDTPGCDLNANPFVQLAQTPDMLKEFGDPRISTYVLTMFGGRSVRDVNYITSDGQPFPKVFYSPDLFNPAISPIPDYRDRIISETSEFVQYLYQTYRGTGKRFILSNWEADNVIRCGEASTYATEDLEATRRPPLKLCDNIVTPTDRNLIPYTSACSDGSQGILAKACAVGQHPNAVPMYVREGEACPADTTREVFPFSLGINGGWIPQDPNDTHTPVKWSYRFRDWCDGIAVVGQNLRTYDGFPGVSDDSVDGYRRIFEAKQEGVRQGREIAATQGNGGMEVYHAPEFNVIHLLKDQGFKNLVHNALPFIDFDFVSYSAYETTNNSLVNPGASPSINTLKLTGDLDYASSLLAPDYVGAGRFRNIIIGEFHFLGDQASNAPAATSVYGIALDTMTNWGVPYAFNWEIHGDEPNTYGLYNFNLVRQSLGTYYRQRYGFQ